MTKLRPLGSEKLDPKEKMQRILELTYYNIGGNDTKKNIDAEYITESSNGFYGIVKERDGYYVKKGLTESTLDYIGGLFMKNKNRFSSYAEALKRLELIKGEENIIQEDTKYVLKLNKTKSKTSAPVDSTPPPIPSELPPASKMGGNVPDMGGDVPDMGGDVPDMGGDVPNMGGDVPNMGGDVPNMDNDVPNMDNDTSDLSEEDYLKSIQKLTGKLGEKLRDFDEKLKGEDVKYVINSVLSAVDLDKLDETDKEDIIDQFDDEENEISSNNGNFDENQPNDEELSEIDRLDKLISTSFDFNDDEEKPYEEEVFETNDDHDTDICMRCRGTGILDDEPCPFCGGEGVITKDKKIDDELFNDNNLATKKRITLDDLYDDDEDFGYDPFEMGEEYTGEESFGGDDITNIENNDYEGESGEDDIVTKEIDTDTLTDMITQTVKNTLENYFEEPEADEEPVDDENMEIGDTTIDNNIE